MTASGVPKRGPVKRSSAQYGIIYVTFFPYWAREMQGTLQPNTLDLSIESK